MPVKERFSLTIVNSHYISVWRGDEIVGEAWRQNHNHDWSIRWKFVGKMREIGCVRKDLPQNVQRHLIHAMLKEMY